MKLSLAAILGLLLLVLLVTLTQCSRNTQDVKTISPNHLLTQLPGLIEQSSDLVVLTVSVDTHAEAKREGLLGANQVEGQIRGVLRIGGDLGLLQVKMIDEERHLLEVRLPQPKILHVSIDHQASTVTNQREGLWRLALGSAYESELTEQLYADTLEKLKQYPLDSRVICQAKLHCETVLRQLIEPHGWSVELSWHQ